MWFDKWRGRPTAGVLLRSSVANKCRSAPTA